MKLLFAKSKWEWWDRPTELFLQKTKEAGFAASEFYLNETPETMQKLVELHAKYDLQIIAQILTEGRDFQQHLDSLERLAEKALKCKPILVNCHPGKDFFSFEENVLLLKRLTELTKETGVPFTAETHRGRATYSLIETIRYLKEIPELLLTTDVSHWMVVHESDLSNQAANLALALPHTRHIHARVGYEEGPQVSDPRAAEWQKHLENHMRIWQKIVDHCKKLDMEYLTITPEFGPPNYTHTLPHSNKPVSDPWEINLAMKELLEKTLSGQ
jgi:Xylose isomerase-like TIM barrel